MEEEIRPTIDFAEFEDKYPEATRLYLQFPRGAKHSLHLEVDGKPRRMFNPHPMIVAAVQAAFCICPKAKVHVEYVGDTISTIIVSVPR